MFLCGAVQGAAPSCVGSEDGVFPLDQGLQLDSLWSSGDLDVGNSVEDHGVSGQLVARQDRLLAAAVAARSHGPSVAGRREGVSILGDIAPSQEAAFLSLQLLDMSHRRWSPCNASVALEFGEIHSLAAAAFATRELPSEGSGRGFAAAASTAAGTWTSAISAHFTWLAHSSCSLP